MEESSDSQDRDTVVVHIRQKKCTTCERATERLYVFPMTDSVYAQHWCTSCHQIGALTYVQVK